MKINLAFFVQGTLMRRFLTFSLINSVTGAVIETVDAWHELGGLAIVNFQSTSVPDFYILIQQKGGGVLASYTGQTYSFAPELNINLKDSASKVYGDNQVLIAEGVYALYNGDLFGDDLQNNVSQFSDGVFDMSDSTAFINPNPLTGQVANTVSYGDFIKNCENNIFVQSPEFQAA